VSVSRSIFALMGDRDRAYFGRGDSSDQIGIIDNMRAVFGRTYAAEPDRLIDELKRTRQSPRLTRYCSRYQISLGSTTMRT
jgi:hypothetical protein